MPEFGHMRHWAEDRMRPWISHIDRSDDFDDTRSSLSSLSAGTIPDNAPPRKIVITVDFGSVNMAFCRMDVTDKCKLRWIGTMCPQTWDTHSYGEARMNERVQFGSEKWRKYPCMLASVAMFIDDVLLYGVKEDELENVYFELETQIPRHTLYNYANKLLGYLIGTYGNRGASVEFMPSAKKLAGVDEPPTKWTESLHKTSSKGRSIGLALARLSTHAWAASETMIGTMGCKSESRTLLEFMLSSKKLDDIADVYNMSVYTCLSHAWILGGDGVSHPLLSVRLDVPWDLEPESQPLHKRKSVKSVVKKATKKATKKAIKKATKRKRVIADTDSGDDSSTASMTSVQ